MRYYIVTPSLNQCDFLRRCIASVRDQVGAVSDKPLEDSPKHVASGYQLIANSPISVHHHVQDAGSTDGTVEFLEKFAAEVKSQRSEITDPNDSCRVPDAYSFSFSSEKDEGMYDAINRGWQRAGEDVDVVAYLNCDEQYLPHALREVSEWFSRHKDKEAVFGNVVLTDGAGEFICCRKVVPPFKWHTITVHLPTYTAATFVRRNTVRKYKLFFDTKWRILGDVAWVMDILSLKIPFGIINKYLATFARTEESLSLSEDGVGEKHQMQAGTSGIIIWLRPFWILVHRVRKLFLGGYWQKPFSYAIYRSNVLEREMVQVEKPRAHWVDWLQRN